ncbi:BMC domain-containing protein [Wukongibacter sp. M2B1]|uniref:BMC domain-containing protein n=1 Tax=Wukongibacter sp. M2B1 TaxID=3088895 RepID=UPI003D78D868
MIGKALGLLETYGYIGAIEAADACLKAANVELIDLELVKGGLVTIKICGDVSAVKASIDAGAAAADRVGKVVSIDVIARMGEGLENIIYRPKKNREIELEPQVKEADGNQEKIENESENSEVNGLEKCNDVDTAESVEENRIEENIDDSLQSNAPDIGETASAHDESIDTAFDDMGDVRALEESVVKANANDIIQYKGRDIKISDEKALINMKVVDLRRIARRVDGISIAKSEIKFAKKRELIEALTSRFNREVE